MGTVVSKTGSSVPVEGVGVAIKEVMELDHPSLLVLGLLLQRHLVELRLWITAITIVHLTQNV